MNYDSTFNLVFKTLEEIEKEAIVETLKETGWKITQSAHLLGIGRATLYRKIKEYGIKR